MTTRLTERAYLLRRCLRLEWQLYLTRLALRRARQDLRLARSEVGPRRKQVKS